MTKGQITHILSLLKYETNKLIPLEGISTIVLEGNFNVYPDENTRVKFVDENGVELLLGYRGKTVNGEFIPEQNPRFAIQFEQIIAFQSESPVRRRSAYSVGLSM